MLLETNPATEVEIPATTQNSEVESNETENEQENQQEQELEENPENEELTEEELEEIEYEGKKYKLAKVLKDAVLRQSDYTKKTQELANSRKKVEEEAKKVRDVVEFQEKEIKSYAELHSYDNKLAEYEQFFGSKEWQDLIDTDTAAAFKHKSQYDTLQNLRSEKARDIEAKWKQASLSKQQEFAKLEEETKATLSREVKGWGSETESKLKEYAKAQGFNEKVFDMAVKSDAIAVKTIHKAYLYDQLKNSLAAKPKVSETPPVKSIKSKNSAANNSNAPSDNDSMDEWIRKRNAQLRSKS